MADVVDHDTDTRAVELSIPATARHLRLVRLAASGFTSDLGLAVDDVEDLRLAVGEASALLIEFAPADARLTVTYGTDDGHLVVQGHCPGRGDEPLTLDPVAEAVMANTVTDFTVEADGPVNRFRLRKRLPQA